MKNIVLARCAVLALVGGMLLAGCSGGDATNDEDFINEARDLASKSGGAPGDSGSVQSNGQVPKIELETNTFEMGTISPEGFAYAEMKVFNRGEGPLRISRVTTTCICTTGKMRKAVIPAGGTGILEITIDPSRIHTFETTKTLTLFSNDPKNPNPTVDVHTRVQSEADFESEVFDMGQVTQGKGASQSVRIRQTKDYPLEIKSVEIRGRNMGHYLAVVQAVPQSEWKTPGKREFMLKVGMKPTIPPGTHEDMVYLHTNLKNQPDIAFELHAIVYKN